MDPESEKHPDEELEEKYYGGHDIRANVDGDESEIVVRLENVHKTYLLGVEGVPALRGVSLSIKQGEFVVVFGLSGGGKTTLLNIIGTIDKPTKGELYLCGHRIDSDTSDEVLSYLRLKKLGFVFQTFNLLSSFNALENVCLPMVLAADKNSEAREKRATGLLKKVGMGERLDHVPSQLSGGEQQRVTVARAVANKPSILLLDEPTGDLDSINTCIVMEELISLNRNDKITLIMVTHDVGLKDFADRVIWMRDGKIKHVEHISPEAKEKRHKKLQQDLKAIQDGQNKPKRQEFKNTFLRKPVDYETHPQHKKGATQPENYAFSSEYTESKVESGSVHVSILDSDSDLDQTK